MTTRSDRASARSRYCATTAGAVAVVRTVSGTVVGKEARGVGQVIEAEGRVQSSCRVDLERKCLISLAAACCGGPDSTRKE